MDQIQRLAELKLEIISQCPLSCIHCSSDSSPSRTEMVDLAQIEGLVAEYAALGGRSLQISGGEPLEHPNLGAILQTLHRHDIATIVYTSGITGRDHLTPLNPNYASQLKPYLQGLVFSVQGGHATIHDSFTGAPGSFEATVESISICKAIGIDVAFHFVPTTANYRSLPELVRLAERLGVTRLSLLRFVPHGRGACSASRLSLDNAGMFELREMVRQLSSHGGVRIRMGSPFRVLMPESTPECNAGINRMLIAPDGTAYPCDAFKGFPINENVNVYDLGIRHVWEQSSFFNRIRDIVRALPDACNHCGFADSCHGGCAAQRVFADMHIDSSRKDPGCLQTNDQADLPQSGAK